MWTESTAKALLDPGGEQGLNALAVTGAGDQWWEGSPLPWYSNCKTAAFLASYDVEHAPCVDSALPADAPNRDPVGSVRVLTTVGHALISKARASTDITALDPILSSDPLSELLGRCAKGDRRAFETLYRKTSPRLYGICVGILKNEELAEEVLQEAFLRIWEKSATYSRAKGSAITWMISIVRNRALDLLRSARTRPTLSPVEAESAALFANDLDPVDEAQLSQDARALINCLQELQDQQRRCIVMAFYYGYTHDELSRLLNVPLGTVKAWVRRGMGRLRQCLE